MVWILLLEVLLALCIFVFIVWWTMFSGRKGGEVPTQEDASTHPPDRATKALPSDGTSPKPPVKTSDDA